jgi:hypothetical protein
MILFTGGGVIMRRESMTILKRFFDPLTNRVFGDLGLRDAKITDYISEVLSRFARTENLYEVKSIQGESLTTVIEMLMRLEGYLDISGEDFDPFMEPEIRQHIGDYTLFMSGIFRDYVARKGFFGYYIKEGEESYRSVAEYHRLLYKPEAGLFHQLAENFERYSGALNYLKKVYLHPDKHPLPYRSLLKPLMD